MDGVDLVKLIGQFGFTGAALYVLGRVVWMIGIRMISAIDALGAKWEAATVALNARIDAHTDADIAALGALKLQVAEFDSKLETLIEWQERTPIAGVPQAPPIVVPTPPRYPQEHRAITENPAKRRGGG